jgi:hypothetical protein
MNIYKKDGTWSWYRVHTIRFTRPVMRELYVKIINRRDAYKEEVE